MKISRLVPVSFLLLFATSTAPAAPKSVPHPQTPIAMSVSGGVSLGSYQAGFLHYQTKYLRANRENVRPWIITGSSAGAINALISVIEYCEPTERKPEDSLFWQTWTSLGFKDLAPGGADSRSPNALFTRAAFLKVADNIERRFDAGLPKSCDVALGVTATLLSPETIDLSNGITVQRQTMRFILRLKGRGAGQVPLIENYADHREDSLQPKLWLDPDPAKRFGQLRELMLASAAFPAAFDPIELRFCPGGKTATCRFDDTKVENFIDGGILENQPLRLALQIAGQSLRMTPERKVFLCDRPDAHNPDLRQPELEKLAVRHVDTDARAYPTFTPQLTEANKKAMIPYLLKFGGNFVSTARTRELYSLIEEVPHIKDRISSTASNFPRASDQWIAFMGFFDRGFREYDFLLGMAEAQHANHLVPLKNPNDPDPTPVDSVLARKLACVYAYSDPSGVRAERVPKHCAEPAYRNVRAIAQTMWTRLAEGCLMKAPTDAERDVFRSCARPWATKSPEWIEPAYANLPWRREDREIDEGIHFLNLLRRYGYEFDRDEFPNAGLPAELQVARKIRKQFKMLARRQPVEDSEPIRLAGEAIANQVYHLSSERSLYVTLGDSNEIAYLTGRFGPYSISNNWRYSAVWQTTHGFDLLKPRQGFFSAALMLGTERNLAHFKRGAIVLKGALRAGRLWSALDTWGGGSCNPETSDYLGNCTGWTIQPALAVTLFDRLRFQFVYRSVFHRGQKHPATEPNMQLGFQANF